MKVRRILLVCVFALVFVLALTACDFNINTLIHQHTVVIDEAVESTCDKTGLTSGVHCSECGEILMAQSEVSLKAHTYDDKYDAFCNVCGYERDAVCLHTELETIPGKFATCKEEGLTDGKRCAKCGELVVPQEIIPTNNNHSFENRICINCGVVDYSKGLEYALNDNGTCYITGIGSCTDTEVYIPPYIDGYKVTSIGDKAFRSCSSLTSIVIPDSVTSIGNWGFRYCSSLTSVVIPNSVTSIGDYAFANCNSLVYNEYDNAYYLGNNSNPYLILIKAKDKTITACNINSETRFIHGVAFSDCSSLTSIVIPNSVTSISSNAFRDCDSLTSIVIPDSVTSIGGSAFWGCSSLVYNEYDNAYYLGNNSNPHLVLIEAKDQSIYSCNINVNTKIIYSSAFSGCSSLKSIVIPDSVTSIDGAAFYNCSSLKSIVIPDSVTSTGEYAFSGCSSLTSVVIPDSVTSIGGYAFRDCSSLTSIVIPDSVTSIGDSAFEDCYSLTSVVIPDSVTSIGNYAFRYCSNLTSIVIPDSVTSIGEYAFYGCSSLTSIVIPDSVTNIGDDAFYGCSSITYNEYDNTYYLGNNSNPYLILIKAKDLTITSYNINSEARFIHSKAFSGCSNLTSIVIPDSVTSIGDGAFWDCSSLTSIVIPDSVTSIGEWAFYDCDSLTSIVIPDSVTSIGHYAFFDCTILTSIVIPDGVTSIGNDTFAGCSSLASIVIPDSVTSIGNYAFDGCLSLTSIVIPDSVTGIGYGAFKNCSSLTSITYTGTAQQWASVTKDSYWKSGVPATEVVCSDTTVAL